MPAELSPPSTGNRISYIAWIAQILFPCLVLVYGIQRLLSGPPPGPFLKVGMLVALAWIPLAVYSLRWQPVQAFAVRYARQLALMVVISVVCLAIGETALRLLFYGSLTIPPDVHASAMREPHPTRGWALMANETRFLQTQDFRLEVSTNSKGCRDVEHDYLSAEDVFRIVVLGDSFMEAYQVELEEALPRRLEAALADRKVEVINLGTGGYGTAQQLRYFLEEGRKYEPDLVLLAFYPGNDIRNNHRGLEESMWGADDLKSRGRLFAVVDDSTQNLVYEEPDYEWAVDTAQEGRRERTKQLKKQSVYKQLLIRRLLRKLVDRGAEIKTKRPTHDPNIWLGPFVTRFDAESGGDLRTVEAYESMWDEAWAITERLLIEFDRAARTEGADFVLFTVPDVIQVEPSEQTEIAGRHDRLEFDTSIVNKRIMDFCTREKIRAVDLLPAFLNDREKREMPLFHLQEDLHWNATGHAVACDALVEYLDRVELIPD